MAEALEGLSGYRRIVDIYDKDPQQHVRQFLERCRDKKMSINKDKWQRDLSIKTAITQFPGPPHVHSYIYW